MTVSAQGKEGPKQEMGGLDEGGGCQRPCEDESARCDDRCNTGDREEGNDLPLRWWPGQDKVTSPDFRGFVIRKSTVATFMA